MTASNPLLPVDELDVLRRRRSAKWHSYPADVLPLTVAELDFALAEPIRAVLRQALDSSDTGYARPAPELGTALSSFAAQRWGWTVDPDQVAAVTDVGVGMVELLRLCCRPGDTVVISPPIYPPFFHWAPEAGVRLAEVPLAPDADRTPGWRLDLAGLEQAFRDGAAAYLLCSPHNPVGLVHPARDLAALVALAERYGVRLISDEIHAPLALPGSSFTPLLAIEGADRLAISLHSASKAWNLAGLKCAMIITDSPAMQSLVSQLPPDCRWRIGHFGVLASVAAYTEGQPWLDQLLATLLDRRQQLGRLLADQLPQLAWDPPQASYLAWLDCRALGTGTAPRDRFLEQGRVALEAGPHFGETVGSGYARLNFGTSDEILRLAIARMAAALN
ncbi:MAG: MalY/PatB family protein [Jatrophihabitans sp.]